MGARIGDLERACFSRLTLRSGHSQVYFYSEQAQSGIAVEYPDIIIHAISRQDGRPGIYCQLESGRFFPNQQIPEEDQEDTVTELKFMPQDVGSCKFIREICGFWMSYYASVEAIYMALSECTALHPDEEFLAEQAALEDEGEFFADPSDEAELNEVQQAALRHLESVFEQPNGQVHQQQQQQDQQDSNDMQEH